MSTFKLPQARHNTGRTISIPDNEQGVILAEILKREAVAAGWKIEGKELQRTYTAFEFDTFVYYLSPKVSE